MSPAIVVTGGAGFIGRAVVARRCASAATRSSPSSATRAAQRTSRDLGAELVEGDLSDVGRARREPLRGADGADPRRGQLPDRDPEVRARPAMWDANVGTTTRLLDAARGRRDAADRLRLDRATSSATRTARSSTRPTGATSAEGFLS